MLRRATYIFIDGSYLLRQHSDVTTSWFGTPKQIDLRLAISGLKGPEKDWGYAEIVQAAEANVVKVFYYDCLVDEKKMNQTPEEHADQVKEQANRLRELREVDDCHIRLGLLKGRQRKQKEVDVLIAVDMITHAARDNMDQVVLVTGDLDLRPAVEALVQFGVSVQIVAYEKTTSTELTWAASAFRKLDFQDFYNWTNQAARSKFPVPFRRNFLPAVNGMKWIKDGSMNGEPCTLYQSDNVSVVDFTRATSIPTLSGQTFSHESLERLELYFSLAYEPIVWNEPTGL